MRKKTAFGLSKPVFRSPLIYIEKEYYKLPICSNCTWSTILLKFALEILEE